MFGMTWGEQPLLLVCELAHFPPEEMFIYLRGRRIKRVPSR